MKIVPTILAVALGLTGMAGAARAIDTIGEAGQWRVLCEWNPDNSAFCMVAVGLAADDKDTGLAYLPLARRLVVINQQQRPIKVVARVDKQPPQQGVCTDGRCDFNRSDFIAALEKGSALDIVVTGGRLPSLVAVVKLDDLQRGAAMAREWAQREAAKRGKSSVSPPASPPASAPPSAPPSPAPSPRPSAKAPPRQSSEWNQKIGQFGQWRVMCNPAVTERLGKCRIESEGKWGGDTVKVLTDARSSFLLVAVDARENIVTSGASSIVAQIDGYRPYKASCSAEGFCNFTDLAFYNALNIGSTMTLTMTTPGRAGASWRIEVAQLRQAATALRNGAASAPAGSP